MPCWRGSPGGKRRGLALLARHWVQVAQANRQAAAVTALDGPSCPLYSCPLSHAHLGTLRWPLCSQKPVEQLDLGPQRGLLAWQQGQTA